MAKKFSRRWLGWLAASAFVATLSACGGDDGATGPAGPAGPAGPPGPSGSTSVDVSTISSEDWANAQFTAQVDSVVVASPPVVTFSVTDDKGLPVLGLEKVKTQTASETIGRYQNLGFTIAKLVPSDANNPSEWKSYVLTSLNRSTGAQTATRPSTDNEGTLEAVDGSPGSYKYTFYRDLPGMQALLDSFSYSGNNRRADLGDVTWDATLPHRLVIQIAGAAPGTGSNTPDGVQVTAGVNMENPVNAIYDFKPGAAGQPSSAIPPDQLTREDVNIASCNVCHQKLAFHGGSARVETRYCVACHTEQRAYGRGDRSTSTATSTALAFPALTETASVNSTTGITSFSYSPSTYVADGEVAGNFTTMIHKIHQGNWLVKDNYNYANVAFNNKGFSKLGGGQRMCTTCHDSSIASTANNYKEKPTRASCGACHDGINWETGGGSTLADKQAASLPDQHTGHQRSRRPRSARRLQVRAVPHRGLRAVRPPHGEHHQEQSGRAARSGVVQVRDPVRGSEQQHQGRDDRLPHPEGHLANAAGRSVSVGTRGCGLRADHVAASRLQRFAVLPVGRRDAAGWHHLAVGLQWLGDQAATARQRVDLVAAEHADHRVHYRA